MVSLNQLLRTIFQPKPMSKALRMLLNRASNAICGIGWVCCAVALSLASVSFADDVPAADGAAEPVQTAVDAAREVVAKRSELAKAYRQAHIDYVKARNEAASQDPEIERMEKRAAALEAEAKRVRDEISERVEKIPQVAALKSEMDAAEARLRELDKVSRPGGQGTGSRRIRRKPDAVPAQE